MAPNLCTPRATELRIVSGPGIPHELSIPVLLEQVEGTIRRTAAPAHFDREPVVVWSEAWLPLIEWPSDQPGVPYDALLGRYYPSEGLVAVDATSGQRWFALDGPRRDVLDLYIRLARTGQVERDPSWIGAHLAAWRLLDEPMPFAVEIGADRLVAVEAEQFWTLLAASEEGEVRPSEFDADASHFGPWAGFVWPVEAARGVEVRLCSEFNECESWRFLGERRFLTELIRGWPSWPGFEVSAELQQFIEARATPPAAQGPVAAEVTALMAPHPSAPVPASPQAEPRSRSNLLVAAAFAAALATGIGAALLAARR